MKTPSIVFIGLTLSTLAGCGMVMRGPNPQPEIDRPVDQTTRKGPFFCQTGEDVEGWECVESETIAVTRKPPIQQERQQASPQTYREQPVQRPKAPIPTPAPPASRPTAPVATPATPAANPARETAATPPPRSATREVPDYVALSYTPDQPVSILDLPETFFAVQLLAVSSKQTLEEYAIANQIRGMSAARVASNGNLLYVLLLGIYETRERAERAIQNLPAPFDQQNPWIRSVGSLQQAMLAGDKIAGNNQLDGL